MTGGPAIDPRLYELGWSGYNSVLTEEVTQEFAGGEARHDDESRCKG